MLAELDLYLPYISPTSPLYLPCISRLAELDAMMGAARDLLARKASVLQMSARRKILRQVRGGGVGRGA